MFSIYQNSRIVGKSTFNLFSIYHFTSHSDTYGWLKLMAELSPIPFKETHKL